MKRYEKFVLEAEKGITFEVSEGTSGELIIRALNNATAKVNSTNYVNPPIPEGYKQVCGEWNNATAKVNSTNYVNPPIPKGYKHVCGEWNNATAKVNSTNYVNPPIPEGYKHVCGEWNNGFVIERCSDGSQFVWIPVESLDYNGTLDGEHFSEKFGRRNYTNKEFSDDKFNEALNDELLEQLESVKKYGGFYISRYNISKSSAGKPRSVKGVMPWVNINFWKAKKIASTMEDNETVKSHLTFGAEYDSVLEWFIKARVKTLAQIAEDSTGWGNHWNAENSPWEVVEETGSSESWCANNIYDFAGNVMEWTQEQYESSYRVIRGGSFESRYPVAFRSIITPNYSSNRVGFRATLYIK